MNIRTPAVIASLLLAAQTFAQGYICAEGGGTGGGPWAAEMYGWMVEKGGHGSVVLLGAVELDDADKPDAREAAFVKAGAKSAKSLVITENNADTQETYDAITSATVIFIRGGSQSRYVQMWKGTKTEAAIREVFKRGGVVGGTSAGCAILGELSYDAINGSLKPDEVVKDGRHPDLTLTKGFLGFAPGVLFDTHFGERARLPRLMTMLAHAREVHKMDVLGAGMDARTALCVSPDGTAEVKGEGVATLLELTRSSKIDIRKDRPPLVTEVIITIVPAGATFDLKSRRFTASLKPIAPSKDNWYFTHGEIRVPEASDEPAPERKERAAPDWNRALTTGGGPVVWVVGNPYSGPRAAMERFNTLACEGPDDGHARVVVMAAPGTEASFLNTSINISAARDVPQASAVVLDTGRALDSFVPGALKKAALHRGMVHLLPPGWGVDLKTGMVAEVPLRVPPKLDRSTGPMPKPKPDALTPKP